MKIAVLSDIHGNHYALQQVLIAAKKDKVERLLILGDIVGYYYHPDKVLSMLQDWNYELIKGNHEKLMEQLLNNSVEKDVLQKKYGSGHLLAIEKLSKQQIQQLINAPEKKKVVIDNVNMLMCHGSNWDADFYLYPDSEKNILDRCNEPDVNFVLIGHSHYPFLYRNINSTLINVGSVGQSRVTGGIANWAIINTMNKCIEIKSTPYDSSPLLREVDQVDPDITYLKDILKRNRH